VTRRLGTFSFVAALLSACLLLAGAAEAGKAPRAFFGAMPQGGLTDQDFEAMGKAKLGTLRFELRWASVNASEGNYDWSGPDSLLRRLAENRVRALPFVYSTPTWVAHLDGHNCSDTTCSPYAPRGKQALDAWAEFLERAVKRYGPDGDFWTENPNVPEVPVRVWQLWNEQNSPSFYKPKPSVKGFAKLMKAGNNAVKGVDSDAEVILGGMFGTPLGGQRPALSAWGFLRKLYDVKGAKRTFDGVAPHPYGAQFKSKVLAQVKLFRDEMVKAHDGNASLWITEMGWASGGAPNPLNRGLKGQASRLKEAFRYFVKHRKKLNIENVDWFSWRDNNASGSGLCEWCPDSGLLREDFSTKPSYDAFTRFTGGS
jgi:hypothetical protein